MNSIGTEYLYQCKLNYHLNVRPADNAAFNTKEYITTVNIAIKYIQEYNVEIFSNFFQESQYLVNLWTAHLIIEYGNPNKKIKEEAIEIITKYSKTPLNEKVAEEETIWLEKNR